jgi:predicted PurR-regulated permease PerM
MTCSNPKRAESASGGKQDYLTQGEQFSSVAERPASTSQLRSVASGASATHAAVIVLAGGAALFLAWMAADTLFLIFAGLLVAALLDACTRGLTKVLRIGHGWNLAIVTAGIAVFMAGLLVWSGFSIALQIQDLLQALNQQLHALEGEMAAFGLASTTGHAGATPIGDLVRFLFPNPHQLFGEAQSALTLTLGGIGETIIVVLIGIFVAVDPAAYRRGIVELLPLRHRRPAGFILDESAMFLRRWLVGQLLAMLVLAILTWVMLVAMNVPSALLLGIQAGLFEFIPYLGAVVGAGPILLMSLPLGTTTLLITLGLYTVIHGGVGYVVGPLIQKQAVHLPPALTLASLILFGALFGIASLVVATPLVAAIRHAVLRLQQSSDHATAEIAARDSKAAAQI